jgi:hypothetical protein
MATLIIEVDAKEAERALKKLNKNIDDTAKKSEKGFNRSSAALAKFSGGIGTISSGLGGLVTLFAAVSAAGVAAFTAIAAEGVQLASQLENARVTFGNIFGGDEGAAEAFLGRLQQQSLELGTNFNELTGFAKALLPDTESIDQFERLTKSAVTLEKSDPDKTIDDVRIAFEGALSGDFVSLQERFDLPKSTINNIKDLQKELGAVEGLVAGLEAEFERTGQSIDSFSETFASTQDRINARLSILQTLLGEPILDALKEEFSAFDDLLADNSETLTLVAQQLGDIAAAVVDFIGTGINDYLSDLDFAKFQELATGFFELIERARLLIDLLFEIDDATPNDSIDFLINLIDNLNSAFETAAQIVALVKAEIAALVGDLKNLAVGFEFVSTRLNLFKEDLSIEDAAARLVDTNQIFEDSLRQSLGTMEESSARLEENTKRQEERSEALKADTSAELDRAAAILKGKSAMKEQEEAAAAAAKAQDEINEKTAKAEEDRQKRLSDIIRKEADKRFDDAVKAAQRREDLARDNVDAIEDIFRKNSQAIESASKDLSQDEQDIARKGARDRRDIERQAAQERVDIERNFRQELKRIQDQFNQEAADAERNNDAQAFLQAVRSRDQQVDVATENRDVSVEEAAINAQRQREELAISLAAEVEDAKIANARKLEELQTRLNQELEAQAIKNQRELEEQAIKEQRLAEQRALALERELEEFAQKEEEKQAKLQESLAKQFEAVAAAEQKQVELIAQAEAEKTAIVQAEAERRAAILSAQAAQRESARQQFGERSALGGEREFGTGGRPLVGEPVIVGDRGPEIFVPDSAGTIIPNNAIFSPPAQPSPAGGSSMTSITNNPTFTLAESMFQDPVARRQLTNFVLGVLAEAGPQLGG